MKPRNILQIMAVMTSLLIFATSQGEDKFYFGTYGGIEHASILKDSLKFNIIEQYDVNDSNIDSLAGNSLRAIVHAVGDGSPTDWSVISHYTLWEAEGLQGSYYKLSYNGGTLVSDPYASGGKAMKFSGPGEPGIIQWGPSYEQEPDLWGGPPINYTAEFRLKFLYSLYQPRGALGGEPPTPVCCIMAVDRGTILMADTLYKSEFPSNGSYKTFLLGNYSVPQHDSIEFKIYWFAPREAIDFRVDYVKVYDAYGKDLMSGAKDTLIMNYVSQDWVHTTIPATGETVVYRWYMRDQPPSVDCFAPYAYIDNLLRQVSTERVGMQVFCRLTDDTLVHEYFLRENPQEYHIDAYPTCISEFGNNFSGSAYQQGMNTYVSWLKRVKEDALAHNKDLWVTCQAFAEGHEIDDPSGFPPYSVVYYEGPQDTGWYRFEYWNREPTPNEIRLQSFSALCYGAENVMYCRYPYVQYFDQAQGKWFFGTGLYDQYADSLTAKWRELKNFTAPRMEKLGPIVKNLTWQGACSDDSVGSFIFRNGTDTSYIKNVVPLNHYPPHVQVGFFTHGDTNYFMLVNRRCLSDEGDSFRVFIETDTTDNELLIYGAEDMYSGYTEGIPQCGYFPEFTVSLEPGEGKLFRLFKWWSPGLRYIFVPQQCSTIQAGINAAQDKQIVLVDTGTYLENINFRGKSIMVTSKFHTTRDTSYISRTIIDGSEPEHEDSASVVRFVLGEDSCACIKGFTLKFGSGTKTLTKDLGPTYKGGGIMCLNSSPTITNNIIISNSADSGSGGGIYCDFNSSPKIINNLIKGNRAKDGGGIFGGSAQTIITNNLIVSDTALHQGGGIGEAFGIITNNTIDGNYASLAGGGINLLGTTCRIVNNIVVNSKGGGGIYFSVYPDSTISYNNIWNNIDGNFFGTFYWLWGDTTWGPNRNGVPCDSFYNIIRDPKFGDGYHLDDSSPCIDAGDNYAPSLPAFDFDGNTRVMDEQESDTFFVDMGAYEHPPGGFGGFGKIVSGGKDTENKSSGEIPDKFSLLQNYPNPFNPTTVVQFKITQPAKVSLKIYNILGQLVKVLVDEEKTARTYTVYWNGTDKKEQPVSSGIYFYKLNAGNLSEVKKMVLTK
jgi:hypothetical protein